MIEPQADFLQKLMIEFSEAMRNYQPPVLEYRAYYDDQGRILTYTTEPQPGNYIVITAKEYSEARPDARVVDGKLLFTHLVTTVVQMCWVEQPPGQAASAWDMNILVDTGDTDDFRLYRLEEHDIY